MSYKVLVLIHIFVLSSKMLNPIQSITNMNSENTQAQMRKGVLEFCILSILAKGDAYTTEIIDKMKSSKLVVVEGTLYPLLTRLKNLGLLTYRWEESTTGPPRKYYKLTPVGKQFLKELEGTWDDLVKAVNKITN
jgi:PadR family transcriptional regulator PadR